MQFGANMVPQTMKSYSYYEEQLYRQLMLIKQLIPDVIILVVGVSDMARRSNGVLASYPNIAKVRSAQRQAAFRAGCAFWDTYEAMGGRNSIISWAYANPILATKDFCHFSNTGATLVAELMYRSFSRDFERYMATKKEESAISLAAKSTSQ
jgi:lysophospholipase L1-like esterase